MKITLVDLLICPACLPEEKGLACNIIEKDGEDVLSGSLKCGECGAEYQIEDGIAILGDNLNQDSNGFSRRYETLALVSSYLWSHYADLMNDVEASSAYREWAGLVSRGPGFALDAGCSVGRFTFEMSKKSDLAIGIDSSRSFIKVARKLMKDREISFDFQEEGNMKANGLIRLPDTRSAEKVEFIVGDALKIPFRSDLFHAVASLNLLDKVPLPLKHLREMNRIAIKEGAQFLFSDPFSWSSDIAEEKEWLGGTEKGTYSGRGIDNVLSILKGEKGEISPGWTIEDEGDIWWKIRNHRNHFELIRSCFIKAVR
jgi:ubiquinone/menaquinone biosynthesis C-methylase UbiE/uncharacterized protein YbaR (Trm112 family)